MLLSARRAPAPKRDLCFIDLVAESVACLEAWCRAHDAVDVGHPTADSTNEVVVIVAHPVLIPSRRSDRLNSSNDPFFDQDPQCVVHRLSRDCANIQFDEFDDLIRADVRPIGNCPQYCKALGRGLDAVYTKDFK
jgi:hypothetical protein